MSPAANRFIEWLLGATLLAALAAGAVAWWLNHPLALAADRVELSIEPGTPVREIAQGWVAAGVRTDPAWLYHWFRLSGDDRRIRAGSYAVERGTSPRQLLQRIVQGDESLERVRLIEGWTWRQVRQALARAPGLRAGTAGLSDAEVMAAIGRPGQHPEGRFYPDTYAYGRGVSDKTVLQRAAQAMDRRLAAAWAARDTGVNLRSPDDLLILASIVEKETGAPADRGLVAGVFANRLRIGMPLQTDPTVIYGLGESFDGNLRKRDLLADGPYNTYTRRGLPPTPIAMPGAAALGAAARPQSTEALYFVARGDGSSVFSATLAEHNRAVDRYQRGR